MAFVLAVCLAAAASATSSQVLPPSQDPWYTAPRGWKWTTPGTVLRIRTAPGNLTSAVVGNTTAAYHILYRTTDSHYQPSWAVTTLFVPKTAYKSSSGRRALLSYQFAYDSANVDSSPSFGLYYALAQPVPSLGIDSDTALLGVLLGNGWFVNTPDYEGPRASFGAKVQSGHATLDAQRAVFNLARQTMLLELADINLVLWGYSGGSYATGAAAELQVQYAPELSIAGAAIGGVVANMSADLANFNGTAIAGDLVSVILGLMAEYPAARDYFESRFVPSKARDFLATYNRTLGQATSYFAFKDIYKYFINGLDDIYSSSVMQRIYARDTVLGTHGVPNIPLYVYKAIGDIYCPVDETDALVDKYCVSRADVTYRRNTVGGHVSEIINGQPGALEWLWGIFNESFVPRTECSIENVTVDISNTAANQAG
jgi:hypothetical protein